MDIIKAFPLLMQQEGIGLTNVAGDNGGLTKFGIAAASHPNVDIANLTEEQAQNIYLNEYWVPSKISQLPTNIQYAVFSCAVNCGVGMATKILQEACNVSADGIIGPQTIAASKNISIQDFCIQWNSYYNKIVDDEATRIISQYGESAYNQMLAKNQTQKKFLKGWQNRINTILSWYKEGKLN